MGRVAGTRGTRRRRPVVVGAELVVFGSSPGLATADTHFLLTNRAGTTWWQLPDPPVAEPLTGVAAIGQGARLVVVGVRCRDVSGSDDGDPDCRPGSLWAGTLDPATGRWTTIPRPADVGRTRPYLPNFGNAVGRDATAAVFRVSDTVQAWNGSRWSRDLVPAGQGDGLCIADSQLVRFTQTQLGPATSARVDLSVLRPPSSTWTTLPSPPIHVTNPLDTYRLVCGSDSMLIANRSLTDIFITRDMARWQPIAAPPRAWVEDHIGDLTPNPDQPLRSVVNIENATWTGRNFYLWQPGRAFGGTPEDPTTIRGNGLVLDATTLTWQPAPIGPYDGGATIVWADGVGYAPRYGAYGLDGIAELEVGPQRA